MQIRFLDNVAVYEAKGTDSCSCKIGRSRAPKTTHTYEQYLGFAQLELSCSQVDKPLLLLLDLGTRTDPATRSQAL
jgi:hypothetical protein